MTSGVCFPLWEVWAICFLNGISIAINVAQAVIRWRYLRGARRGLGPVRVTWFYADTLCCRKCGELSSNAGVWPVCPACGFPGELTS